jgi:tRNA pseudouridine synthase 9
LEKELMRLRGDNKMSGSTGHSGSGTPGSELLPREMEDDTVVGGSPIYLSREAREIVAKLRRQKDEQEDWAKWVTSLVRLMVAC